MALEFKVSDRKRLSRGSLQIASHEMRKVKGKLIRIAQRVWYTQEYRRLFDGEMIVEGKLLNLNPNLDEDGFMRAGGKLLLLTVDL